MMPVRQQRVIRTRALERKRARRNRVRLVRVKERTPNNRVKD
jgi:hypothetical protein